MVEGGWIEGGNGGQLLRGTNELALFNNAETFGRAACALRGGTVCRRVGLRAWGCARSVMRVCDRRHGSAPATSPATVVASRRQRADVGRSM